jgi:hypothetical protein
MGDSSIGNVPWKGDETHSVSRSGRTVKRNTQIFSDMNAYETSSSAQFYNGHSGGTGSSVTRGAKAPRGVANASPHSSCANNNSSDGRGVGNLTNETPSYLASSSSSSSGSSSATDGATLLSWREAASRAAASSENNSGGVGGGENRGRPRGGGGGGEAGQQVTQSRRRSRSSGSNGGGGSLSPRGGGGSNVRDHSGGNHHNSHYHMAVPVQKEEEVTDGLADIFGLTNASKLKECIALAGTFGGTGAIAGGLKKEQREQFEELLGEVLVKYTTRKGTKVEHLELVREVLLKKQKQLTASLAC